MTPEEARSIVQELASVCRGAWSSERVQVYRGVLAGSGLEAAVGRRALRMLLTELPPDDITPSELIRQGRKLTVARIGIEDQRSHGVLVPREEAIERMRAIRAPLERKMTLPGGGDRVR